jgi:hypothetical protein
MPSQELLSIPLALLADMGSFDCASYWLRQWLAPLRTTVVPEEATTNPPQPYP